MRLTRLPPSNYPGPRLESGAVEQVRLARLHRVEAEREHRLDQDHGAGDDSRSPVRKKPADAPALVNVLTDPSVAYPRRSNLA